MQALLIAFLLAAAPLSAEINFITGPATANIGDVAEIQVPDGWRFVPKESMEAFDKASNNLYASSEVGALLGPEGDKTAFWAFFEWDEIGYVKDAATEKLDADALWKEMVAGQEAGNEARKEQKMPAMDLVKWEAPPSYNPATQRLEWATRLRSQGKEFVNFSTKILGRHGVMRVVVVPQGELEEAMPVFNEKIAEYKFKPGKTYAEWLPSDKVAKVGLSALVVGGAGALALKSGLLGKLWKLIVVAIIAAFGAVKKLFNKVTGKEAEETPAPSKYSPPPDVASADPAAPVQRRSEAQPTLDDGPKH